MIRPPRIDNSKVWYASYGSNLFPARFMLYINGGVAPGSEYLHEPSPSKEPLGGRFAARLPFRLIFGGTSLIWDGMAKAYLDPVATDDPAQHAIAELYLINRVQFEHVVWQENAHLEDPAPLRLPFEQAMRSVGGRAPSGYASNYDLLLFCGYAPGRPGDSEANVWHPVFTFTRSISVAEGGDVAVPSPRYLRFIAAGLRSATRLEVSPGITRVMSDEDIATYLHGAPGAHMLPRATVQMAVGGHLLDESHEVRASGVPNIIVPGVVPYDQWSKLPSGLLLAR